MSKWNWIMLAVFFVGYGIDFVESAFMRTKAGREEGHPWFRNPDGSLNRVMGLTVAGIVYVIFSVLMYWMGNRFKSPEQDYNVGLYTVTGSLMAAGIAHAIMGIHNYRKNLKRMGRL